MTNKPRRDLLLAMVLVGLTPLSACSQKWTFARPAGCQQETRVVVADDLGLREVAGARTGTRGGPSGCVTEELGGGGSERLGVASASSYSPRVEAAQTAGMLGRWANRQLGRQSSDGSLIDRLLARRQGRNRSIVPCGAVEELPQSIGGDESTYEAEGSVSAKDAGGVQWTPESSGEGCGGWRRFECGLINRTGWIHRRLPLALCETRRKIRSDHRNFYSWWTGRDMLLAIAGGSILANTSLDHDFRDWVQDDIRSDDTDNFAAFWKTFGEGEIFIPAFVGLGLSGWLLEDWAVGNCAKNFGWRTGRAYLVGAPPVLFFQACLGGSRPGETSHESSWRFFGDNNGVSGHAFIGAVPFITAGNMCRNPYLAGCFYFMSVLPGWSRINDDAHYLSQVALGWYFAYLSCRCIEQTDCTRRCETFSIVPVVDPRMAGFMATYAF